MGAVAKEKLAPWTVRGMPCLAQTAFGDTDPPKTQSGRWGTVGVVSQTVAQRPVQPCPHTSSSPIRSPDFFTCSPHSWRRSSRLRASFF